MSVTHRFQAVGPHTFRIGDIVEMQVSFVAVPLKEQKYKMMVVLRSIARQSKELMKKRIDEPEKTGKTTLKRRVGYEEEESKRGREMEVDDKTPTRQAL